MKVINYIPGKKTPLLIFCEERLDEKNLSISPQNYKVRKQRYEKRLFKMVQYAKNDNVCRNILILDYFGEKTRQNCGQCDVCRKEVIEGLSNFELNEIRQIFIKNLSEKKMLTEELINFSYFDHEKNMKTLRIMLDSEEIAYDLNHMLMLNQK